MEILDFTRRVESYGDPELNLWSEQTRVALAQFVLRAGFMSQALTEADRKEYQELVANSLADISIERPILLSLACQEAVIQACDNGVRELVLVKTTTEV